MTSQLRAAGSIPGFATRPQAELLQGRDHENESRSSHDHR